MVEKNDLVYTIVFTSAIILLLVVFITFFVVQQLRRKQKYLLEKQQLNAKFHQELLQAQIEIQEQTLSTISREIHDNIGQTLIFAKLSLATLPLLADDSSQKKIDTARIQIRKAINDLRDLSRSMHGDKMAEIGLAEAIAGQLKIIQNSGQFVTSLNITGTSYAMEPKKEIILFRMAQEILNNAVKHSKASQISVSIIFENQDIALFFTDNGIGFDPVMLNAKDTGIGLVNIYSRADLINAKIGVNSSPGNGTRISIEIKNL